MLLRHSVPLLALLSCLPAQKATAPADSLTLRLVPLLDGLRTDGRLDATTNSPFGKEAAKLGIDLSQPKHPMVLAELANGRLVQAFCSVTENAFGDRAWLVQRTRKIDRRWTKPEGPPVESFAWEVRVLKTQAGTAKTIAKHVAIVGPRDAVRRELVQEFEVGYGAIDGVTKDTAWPFDEKSSTETVQPFADQPGAFDKVKFTRSRTWTLTTSIAKDGGWTLQAPELGIDLPKSPPPAEVPPTIDEASKAIVLTIGTGCDGVQLGASTVAEVTKALGDPLEDVLIQPGSRNVSYRCGLTCNFDKDGKLKTIMTRPSFGGRTSNGIALGTTIEELKKLYSKSDGAQLDPKRFAAPGLLLTLDAFGKVRAMVLVREVEKR